MLERLYPDKHERQQGSVVGLSIALLLANAHGGQITVESQVGVGTRFNVWLPAMGTHERTVITKRMSQ